MIAASQEASAKIAAALRGQVSAFALPLSAKVLCDRLMETTCDAAFPGALIPQVNAAGQVEVLAAASPASWRRLQPILRSFAGPTLTSFDGAPSSQPVSSDLLNAIAKVDPVAASAVASGVTASIQLPNQTKDMMAALRALVRAYDTLARAPALTSGAPEPTAWLLARFQDHLNVGNRHGAEQVLGRLRDELRVDALNLGFLRTQMLATFEDWAGVVAMDIFAILTRARRTPATTGLLLEALYQAHLAPPFDAGDQQVVESVFAEEVRSLAVPMLRAPLPQTLRIGGWRIVALEALASPSREDLRLAASNRVEALGWLAPGFANTVAPVPQPDPELDAVDEARDRLVAGEAAESVGLMSAALTALARLDQSQFAEVARAEPARSALRALEEESRGATVPTSWTSWLDRIADPSFANALELARLGADEWLIAGEAADPAKVATLLASLEETHNNELAKERSTQALPYLVAALRRDPLFPNPALRVIYSGLLTLLALGPSRGAPVYDSSIILVDALLEVGIDARQYRDLVSDITEIAGDGFGVRMVYWLLEVVEAFMRAPATDAAVRENFVHFVLARLAPIRGRLSRIQQAAVQSLSSEFGWTLDAAPASQVADEFATYLSGKSIAIYSLVESASRQAKAALQDLAPNLDVECSADHGGTTQLRTMATNCDLFVIAWSAAKHAATDFIRAHRRDRPLVFAQGKGVSSLLRAVEEHCLAQIARSA